MGRHKWVVALKTGISKLEDWQELWVSGSTPWVGGGVNTSLFQFLPRLEKEFQIGAGKRALVPLCGDSPAVRMLFDAGYDVTAVEFVPEALAKLQNSLFADTAFTTTEGETRAERIRLRVSDIFDFSDNKGFDFVYDRAAFVALDPVTQKRFAKHISEMMRPGAILLSRTAELCGPGAATWQGPPYSVTLDDVRTSYSSLDLLEHEFELSAPSQERYLTAGICEIKHLTALFRR